MRIVIDLQGAQSGSRHRGIGRYSLALARAMVLNKKDHEIIIALNSLFPETIEPIRTEFEGILPQENIRVWHAVGPVHAFDSSNEWRKNTAELIRETFLASLNPDIVHITSLFEGFGDNAVHSIGRTPFSPPTAVTFYDLIPLIQKDTYLKPNPHFKKPFYEKIGHLEKANLLLAISESSRQEAIQYLHTQEDSIINISAAADSHFQKITIDPKTETALYKKFGINRKFIMYSGATDDRKNHIGLINAYLLLPEDIRQNYQLALVGGLPLDHRSRFEAHIKSCGLSDMDIVITGRVSDDELLQFYNLCALYVFPSQHEGFGLPVLEAMSCGAAVIGSNNTSIPEVIGFNEALFDPYSEESIAQKITQVLSNDILLEQLKQHSIKQAAKFTWNRSAKIAMNSFEEWHANQQIHSKTIPNISITDNNSWLINEIAHLNPRSREANDWLSTAQSIARNETKETKQLFVDISELVQRDGRTGVQRVVRSVLHQLLINPPKNYTIEPIFATNEKQGYFYAKSFMQQFMNQEANNIKDEPIDYRFGDLFLGLDMQHHIQTKQAAFYQELRRSGIKVFFILHDLLPVLSPKFFPKDTFLDHKKWVLTLADTDGILCVSKTVATELTEWLEEQKPMRQRPLMIGWFHNGADITNSVPSMGLPNDASHTLNLLNKAPTFLSVGTIEPRKGQVQTLRAFEAMWQNGSDINLVFVGKQGWDVEPIIEHIKKHSELGKHLFWMANISDEYLEKIYESSTCLIAASEGEGFGLPLIEAAQHGIPIIARNIPVFKEVAGEYAYYFDGLAPQDIINAVTLWLMLNEKKQIPLSHNIPWNTWEQSTQQILKLITLETKS
ncbi:Mannosylfructose-phosphate synthase [Ephemeroptericola cinctiostellae]|uniref:Mannosylfructose-phosphate synthase n=1 Tax=Ephemeroptericola cinctiostellae TaxID=2268024 RepID=A0A345DA27_9BURK|nr:glycosyltransferase family 1 protein [Ephemeroptericola cinctiostellae]AXF85215.1 Mannosylfructose-phosphate synthase [Ephemeroptericola cinctiostellae]